MGVVNGISEGTDSCSDAEPGGDEARDELLDDDDELKSLVGATWW